MPEITIPLVKPGVRKQVEPKTFNQLYILNLQISANSMGAEDMIYAEYCPFDKTTGDRLLEDKRELFLQFWHAVAAVPEAAAAFAAVAAAMPALIAYQEQQMASQTDAPEENP